jgi:hypothetical protein
MSEAVEVNCRRFQEQPEGNDMNRRELLLGAAALAATATASKAFAAEPQS